MARGPGAVALAPEPGGGDESEAREARAEPFAFASPLPFSCPRLSLKALFRRALLASPCLVRGGVAATLAGSEEELFWVCADTRGPSAPLTCDARPPGVVMVGVAALVDTCVAL